MSKPKATPRRPKKKNLLVVFLTALKWPTVGVFFIGGGILCDVGAVCSGIASAIFGVILLCNVADIDAADFDFLFSDEL